MAATAAITLSASTVKAEQTVTATCTVTNGGTNSINVTAVVPKAVPTGGTTQSVSVALGLPSTGPGMTVAVAGSSGTLAIPFQVTPHAPASGYGLGEPSQFVYDIGATVYTNDGQAIAATATTLTVNYPNY